MTQSNYEVRLKALKDELIALNNQLDDLPVDSAEYDDATLRLVEVTTSLANLDDEFNRQKRN